MRSNDFRGRLPDEMNRIPRRSLLAGLVFAIAGQQTAVLAGSFAAQAKSASAVSKHRVVILIDSDVEQVMGHAISYSTNIKRFYELKNGAVQIEIVANGSGIKLFRADTSPLQRPLAALRQDIPNIVFSMCDSSRKIAEEREKHAIGLIAGARLVPFGIGRVVELEEAGWSFVRG